MTHRQTSVAGIPIGRQALPLQLTLLDPIVRGAVKSLRRQSSGRAVDWRISELGCILGDAELVRYVFVELLTNALRYSQDRDPAIIEVGQARLKDEQVFFVRDNGLGFDMRQADKLFAGPGLATVEGIVRRHGGRLWTQAEPGVGATFFFTFSRDAGHA
ncbi:MAG: ATP-binding protein [Steroidobacteraceae bacterium]